jgi:hypothetical protein
MTNRGRSQPVLDFHLGVAPDHAGRHIGDILGLDDAELESTHDYIQWLFPLAEPSRAVPTSPVIGPTEIADFRQNESARAMQIRALERMLRFYGLRLDAKPGGSWSVTPAANFSSRRREWLTPGNHNLLRLTRIMKSLILLGHRPYAEALFRRLETLYQENPSAIGPTTFRFWQEAIGIH